MLKNTETQLRTKKIREMARRVIIIEWIPRSGNIQVTRTNHETYGRTVACSSVVHLNSVSFDLETPQDHFETERSRFHV